MPLSLLFSRRTQRQNAIGTITIDATLSENHEAVSEVTREPIEDGSNITDHIFNEPERISIEGFISNTPITGGFANNSQTTFDELYSIRDNKQLVTVVTSYRVYSDMAITRISIPRDVNTGQAIRFNVDLVKIRKSGSTSVSVFSDILSTIGGVADQASSRLNLGRVTTSTAGAAASNIASSLVGRIL